MEKKNEGTHVVDVRISVRIEQPCGGKMKRIKHLKAIETVSASGSALLPPTGSLKPIQFKSI